MTDERAATAIDHRLGQRVRARRLEISMSQERLAELLGVTFQQIQKYEKGVNRVAASRLFELSIALEVPVGYFFEGLTLESAGGVAEDGVQAPLFDILSTPEGQQLVMLFGAIQKPRLRRRVVELVRALVEDEMENEAASRDERP